MSDSFEVERTEPLLQSEVFSVERRTIRHDGTTFTRDVAVHRGAVAILAINDEGEIELVLDGPAGGKYSQGVDGERVEIDAVDFIRTLASRLPGTGVLSNPLPL